MDEKLTEANFILYAAKYYDNPSCHGVEEFYDDVKRFKYLKKLFGRYEETGELKDRLILNHIIILYNVFGIAATKMLFFKLEKHHSYLKPFIVMLGYMPEVIFSIGDTDKLFSSDIPMDQKVVEILRNI